METEHSKPQIVHFDITSGKIENQKSFNGAPYIIFQKHTNESVKPALASAIRILAYSGRHRQGNARQHNIRCSGRRHCIYQQQGKTFYGQK